MHEQARPSPQPPAHEQSTHERAGAVLERAVLEVERVLVGQDRLVERLFTALLARGHCLLEGPPGVAKTLAARTQATVVGGHYARIQFTPDLVPADIVGTRIYRPSSETFDVELGPVFANVLLADEINRAPAKVQSALLEAMAEGHVSLAGRTHPVPDPFLVLATQNPVESDGVYPLPEAQRDRFLLKVAVGYPTEAEELAILARMGRARALPQAQQVLTPQEVRALRDLADDVFVHPAIAQYAVRLVMTTRDLAGNGLADLAGALDYGASPRSSLGLVASARALALLRGRGYVLPGDVADLAEDVMAHRIGLSFDALADGLDPRDLVRRVLGHVPQPRIAPAQPVAA
jgi:MoxR-like ATPase